MSDYIKRADAINAVADYLLEHRGTGTLNHIQDASVIINIRCPSADVVERKKGEWIVKKAPSHGYGDIYICPFCEGDVECVPTNFCPWCGADMRTDRKE